MSDFIVLTGNDLFQPIEDVEFENGISPKNEVEFHLCLDEKNFERFLSLYLSNGRQMLPDGIAAEDYYGECVIKMNDLLPRDYRLPHRFAIDIKVFDEHDNAYDLAVAAILTRQSRLEISQRKGEDNEKVQLVFELHISGFVTESCIDPIKVTNLIAIDDE